MAALVLGASQTLAAPIGFDFRVERPDGLTATWQLSAGGESSGTQTPLNYAGSFDYDYFSGTVSDVSVSSNGKQLSFGTAQTFNGSLFIWFFGSAPGSDQTGATLLPISSRDGLSPGNPEQEFVDAVSFITGTGEAGINVPFTCQNADCTRTRSQAGGSPILSFGFLELDPSTIQRLSGTLLLQVAGDPNVQALQDLKSGYGDTADQFQTVSDAIPTNTDLGPDAIDNIGDAAERRAVDLVRTIRDEVVDTLSTGAEAVVEYFALAVKTVTKGGQGIFTTLKNDPPRTDFDQLTQASLELLDFRFGETYGAEYGLIDDAFLSVGHGLETLERILLTVERVQGATLLGDQSATETQLSHLEMLYETLDLKFLDAATALDEIIDSDFAGFAGLKGLASEAAWVFSDARPSTSFRATPETAPVPLPAGGYLLLVAAGILLSVRRWNRIA